MGGFDSCREPENTSKSFSEKGHDVFDGIPFHKSHGMEMKAKQNCGKRRMHLSSSAAKRMHIASTPMVSQYHTSFKKPTSTNKS